MAASNESRREERVAAVVALAGERGERAGTMPLAPLADEYFRQVDPEDLEERTPEDLLGAVLAHWQLAAQRLPDTPRVRVFSPSPGADGWGSRHTVVQIVNDDMPFLVDSVSMEIARQGLALHLIVHPVFAVQRDAQGQLQSVAPRTDAPDWPRESWMYLEVDRLVDAERRTALCAGLERVLADVRAAVRDWQRMRERLRDAAAELERAPAAVPAGEAAEARAFLQWLAEDHFTLLGYRRNQLLEEGGELALNREPGSGLGLLNEDFAMRIPPASPRLRRRRARCRARLHPCWWSCARPTPAPPCTATATPTTSA